MAAAGRDRTQRPSKNKEQRRCSQQLRRRIAALSPLLSPFTSLHSCPPSPIPLFSCPRLTVVRCWSAMAAEAEGAADAQRKACGWRRRRREGRLQKRSDRSECDGKAVAGGMCSQRVECQNEKMWVCDVCGGMGGGRREEQWPVAGRNGCPPPVSWTGGARPHCCRCVASSICWHCARGFVDHRREQCGQPYTARSLLPTTIHRPTDTTTPSSAAQLSSAQRSTVASPCSTPPPRSTRGDTGYCACCNRHCCY